VNPKNNTTLSFLIDTSADISICKNTSINHRFDKTKQCKITGITNDEILSLEKATIDLYYKETIVQHEFHIVNSNLPLATDGILGRDFLMNYLAKIDYGTFTLQIMVKNEAIILPMRSKFKTTIEVPARSEVIQAILLHLKEDSIICNQEMIKGVFLANSIVPAKGIAHVKILNTLDRSITLSELKPKIHPLREYDITDYQRTARPSKKKVPRSYKKIKFRRNGPKCQKFHNKYL